MDDLQKITITICGDGGAGKSSITLRLVRCQWTHEYDPTIEDSYTLTRRIDGQTYHLSLTDTAGQEEYRGMWASSNLRSDAFLLVYDITNAQSLHVLQEFNDLIDIEAETRMDAWEQDKYNAKMRSRGKPMRGPVRPIKIVAGNKCDLQQSRQVPAQVGLDWARKRGCGFMETSARNTVNIEETFALLIRRVVEARRESAGEEYGMEQRMQSRGRSGSVPALTGWNLSTEAMAPTSRAPTKPLSPLPAGAEKLHYGAENGAKAWFREIMTKLRCW